MTRSPEKVPQLEDLGALPVVCDVFDLDALVETVGTFEPDAIIHELTDLPDDASRISEFIAATSRIRGEGTRNLVTAAQAAGTARIVAQSVAWLTGDTITYLEDTVLNARGVVLRYGKWYGPGTHFENGRPPSPRVHIDTAAARTVSALDDPPGIYIVTDDG
jgi:nucleoside-diphosphate-sugar epimerase